MFRSRSASGVTPALLVCVLSLMTGVGWLTAQNPPVPPQQPAPTIRVETRLVLVDVVVTDKKGNPVRGLTKEDFTLKENGKVQGPAVFSWEGREEEAVRLAPPPLPENTYTNQPEYHAPPGPLTIILLDSLNTSLRDQVNLKIALLQYLTEQFKAGQTTAILALIGNRVVVLQDFTTDPKLMAEAIERFKPQVSALLSRRESLTSKDQDFINSVFGELSREFGNREAFGKFLSSQKYQITVSDQERMRRTMAALGGIARAVIGYPGRKNLIWASSSFPGFFKGDTMRRYSWNLDEESRRLSRLFNDARLVIYAVDPRGLDPAQRTRVMDVKGFLPNDPRPADLESSSVFYSDENPLLNRGIDSPIYNIRESQMSMKTLADNTGGKAYYNRNDIGNAVAEALADGSAYYTLGYYPTNKKWDGKFRKIQVKLAKKGYQLRYRKGYHATEPTEMASAEEAAGEATEGVTALAERNLLQIRSALHHPLPATGLTVFVKVPPPLPRQGRGQRRDQPAAIAANVNVNVAVQVLVDTKGVTFREQGALRALRYMDLDFVLAAFSPQGEQLKNSAQRFRKTLTEEQYRQVLAAGMLYPMSLQLEPGRYVLRLLVRDNLSGKLGRVDVPLTITAPAEKAAQ